LALLFSSSVKAGEKPALTFHAPAKVNAVQISDAEVLDNSQVSYRADGGFTGIESYGVIVSCVKGRISVLKTIHDPGHSTAAVHQKGTMDHQTYLQLWKGLRKQGVFVAGNIPEPKLDIEDQFTVKFEAKAGGLKNEFRVHGIGRPEACQHFAIKSLIDHSVQMQAFMEPHETLARR
jgi:hypothetical protein